MNLDPEDRSEDEREPWERREDELLDAGMQAWRDRDE